MPEMAAAPRAAAAAPTRTILLRANVTRYRGTPPTASSVWRGPFIGGALSSPPWLRDVAARPPRASPAGRRRLARPFTLAPPLAPARSSYAEPPRASSAAAAAGPREDPGPSPPHPAASPHCTDPASTASSKAEPAAAYTDGPSDGFVDAEPHSAWLSPAWWAVGAKKGGERPPENLPRLASRLIKCVRAGVA